MTDPEPKFSLADLIAAERAIEAEAGADARIWAAIERRLVDGPPPPDLGAGTASSLLKWAAGLALAGGVVGGAALGLAGGDPEGGGEATRSIVGAGAEAGEAATAASDPGTGGEADDADSSVTTTTTTMTTTDHREPAATTMTQGHVEEDMSSGTSPSTGAAAAPEPSPRPRRPARAPRSAGDPPAADPGAAEPAAQGLDAELRLIARIRGALRRGDPAGALALIADHRRLFADGALVQERWAHEVEALCAVGRRREAEARAAEFLKRWPDSTHRAAVQAGCGD